jgi:hypothetical protein
MREIRIPLDKILDWVDNGEGRFAVIPVNLGFPELRLTNDQMLANAVALADGEEQPFPDLNLVSVIVE